VGPSHYWVLAAAKTTNCFSFAAGLCFACCLSSILPSLLLGTSQCPREGCFAMLSSNADIFWIATIKVAQNSALVALFAEAALPLP